jgi:hypothetical protein
MGTGARDEPVNSRSTRNIGIILSGMRHQLMGFEPIRLPVVEGLAEFEGAGYAEGQRGD